MTSVSLQRHPTFESNFEVVECFGPVLDRHRPFLRGSADREADNLPYGVVSKQSTSPLHRLSDQVVDRLYRVCRADDPANILRIVEEWSHVLPAGSPGLTDRWELAIPRLFELVAAAFTVDEE